MSDSFIDLSTRRAEYCRRRGITVEETLGAGAQGTVFSTDRKTAVKVHDREVAYLRERDVYLRLRDYGVEEVAKMAVPRLIHFDDELLAFEMTVVKPPFVLDFGGAYLDIPPNYPPEKSPSGSMRRLSSLASGGRMRCLCWRR